MFPVTALTFVAIKFFLEPDSLDRSTFIYQTFFWSWLALTVLFTALRNNWLTNKICLILGGSLGLLVPIANGIMSGSWFWESFALGHSDVFLIDVFWLVLALITLWIGFSLKQKSVKSPVEEKPKAMASSI